MVKLIDQYWSQMTMVARAGGCYGAPFKGCRGVTQGNPLSPKIFNIVVDVVIRRWLEKVSDEAAGTSGFGSGITGRAAFFYADDGLVASTNRAWLQYAFEVLTELFERMGLKCNIKKTVVMICHPGFSPGRQSQEAYV